MSGEKSAARRCPSPKPRKGARKRARRVCSAPRGAAQAGLTEGSRAELRVRLETNVGHSGQPKATPNCFQIHILDRRRPGEILPSFAGFFFPVRGIEICCRTLAFSRYRLCGVPPTLP